MKIKFLPQNIEVEATPDKSLLQIATENHLEIRSICKGVPSCAECRVRIQEGDQNTLPPNKAELSLIGTNYFIDGRRLSCQVRCFGDVTVDLTEQVERQENQTKKIRGFRSKNQVESKAVNDMMLLDEKEALAAAQAQPSKQEASSAEGAEAQPQQAREQKPQQQQREHRPQQQGQKQQNQNKQQHQNKQQQQNKNQNQQRQQNQQGKQQHNQQKAQGQKQGNPKQQGQQHPQQHKNQQQRTEKNQQQNQNQGGDKK